LFFQDGRAGFGKGWAASQGRLGRRDVGRKMGRFKAGDRDCLCAVAHLEEEGMWKPAWDPVRSGILGGREWRVLGVARMKTKGVFMRGRAGRDFAHLAL
jgi:hypothetical protein